MKQYTPDNLVIHPNNATDPDVIVEVTPANAGWDTITFQARRLAAGQSWSFQTDGNELALVVLGGTVDVDSNRGQWQGARPPRERFRRTALRALPAAPHDFTVTATTDCEFAVAWVPADRDHEPQLITPAEVGIEIRGGDHATRQINRMLPPGFPCPATGRGRGLHARRQLVELSAAQARRPHGRCRRQLCVQADLDEIYYYKIDRPEGYALQRVYTDADSPLHRAGYPIDAAVIARNDDVVLIPEGYHPVSSPVGYTTYYLNVLAGSAQSLAAKDDPEYAWIKDTYQQRSIHACRSMMSSDPRRAQPGDRKESPLR